METSYQILIRWIIHIRISSFEQIVIENSCPVHCAQEFQPIEYPGSQARDNRSHCWNRISTISDSELSNRDLTISAFRHGSTSLRENLGRNSCTGWWAEWTAVKRERWRCSFEKRWKKNEGGEGRERGKWNDERTERKERKGKERRGKRFPRFLSKENSSKENRKVRGNVHAYLNEASLDTRK